MKLTGKSLEQFDKWYMELRQVELDKSDLKVTDLFCPHVSTFHHTLLSCQYGVLVDFFDSVGIEVNTLKISFDGMFHFEAYDEDKIGVPVTGKESTRPQSRAKAIERANEIYNNR